MMENLAVYEESLIPISPDGDALKHAIAAAELYMKAWEETKDSGNRKHLRRKCSELLKLAEDLKRRRSHLSQSHCQIRPIPVREQAIVLHSSRLNGSTFPPWESDPDPSHFLLTDSGPFVYDHLLRPLYIEILTVDRDNTEYTLSRLQQENMSGWRRPQALFANSSRSYTDADLMQPTTESQLVQDVTADCSVVASLCSSLRLMMPGEQSILRGLCFPFDMSKSRPLVSDNGKYVFKMNFNGCFRRVDIDDRLPASKSNRTLFVSDVQNPFLIWPALLEKAYLKVRGGYDFPGSNSGTDLWIMTGWIPEQLFLQTQGISLDNLWSKILPAFRSGNLIITLGTGRIPSEEEEATGLIGEHDYAVMDLDSHDGYRVLVRNPWYNSLGTRTPSDEFISSLDPSHGKSSPSPLCPPGYDTSRAPVWMTLHDIAQHFESIYLNWNPSIFEHRQDHHFTWEIMKKKNMSATSVFTPQYCIQSTKTGPVWIVLARHFRDEDAQVRTQRSSLLPATTSKLGYISVGIFKNDGKAVEKTGAKNCGPFVDSPQTLAKLDAEEGVAYTVVPLQDKLMMSSYNFTLSIFSHYPLAVGPASQRMRFYSEELGSWTRRSAGGNTSAPTYGTNPQYSISTLVPTSLTLMLCTDNTELAIHISLVLGSGRRVVSSPALKEIVADSREYVHGCALLDVPHIDAGTFTVVCSTFEVGQVADFTLRVGTQSPHKLASIPADGAGRFQTKLGTVFLSGSEEICQAKVDITSLTRVYATASCRPNTSPDRGSHGAAPALRISWVLGTRPNQITLSVSCGGEFRDARAGLRTPEFDIEPTLARGGLWLVIERLGTYHPSDMIDVEIFSDSRVTFGDWEVIN